MPLFTAAIAALDDVHSTVLLVASAGNTVADNVVVPPSDRVTDFSLS